MQKENIRMRFAKVLLPALALFLAACAPSASVPATDAPAASVPAVEPAATVDMPVDTLAVVIVPTLPAESDSVPNIGTATEAASEISTEISTETSPETTEGWTREQFNTAWDIAYPAGWTVNSAGAYEGAIQLQGDFQGHTYAVTFSYPMGILAQSLDAWVEEETAALTLGQQAAVVTSDLTVANAPAKQLLNFPNPDGISPMHRVYIWRAAERNPRLITIAQVDGLPVDAAAMESLLAHFLAGVH
jgi:hypothetical protein